MLKKNFPSLYIVSLCENISTIIFINFFQTVYLCVYLLGCRDKGGGRDTSHCRECEGRDGAAAEGCHNVTLHYCTQHSASSVIVCFIHDL